MAQQTCMFIHTQRSFPEIGEYAHIALGALRADGWTIDRIEPEHRLVLAALPYFTPDEEQIRKAALARLEAETNHRLRAGLKTLTTWCVLACMLPVLFGAVELFQHRSLDGFFLLFNGFILAGLALVFLAKSHNRSFAGPAPEGE